MSKIMTYSMCKKTLVVALVCGFLVGCSGKKAEEKKQTGVPPTVITTTLVKNSPILTVEKTLGEIESINMPQVAAEVAGQLKQVFVDVGDRVQAGQTLAIVDNSDYQISQAAATAEIKRQEVLLENQARLAQRYKDLAAQNFISKTKLEETESQLQAQREQLETAKAQLAHAARTLTQTKIVAPLSGKIEARYLSVGDYVTPGKNIFQIAQSEKLRIRLPFPEGLATKIQPGQPVRLRAPAAPDHVVTAKIQEIKNLINNTSRSVYALVEIDNPGGWQAGGTVNAEIVLGERTDALVVPAQSVVLRPAGKVVYVVQNNIVKQRLVKTGEKQEDMVEILEGLKAGEVIAFNGAGFLSDQTKVTVKTENKPAPPSAPPAKPQS